VRPQEDNEREGKRSHERGHQPEITHLRRITPIPQRVDRKQGRDMTAAIASREAQTLFSSLVESDSES